MGRRTHIDWRFYADILALMLAILLGFTVAYQFESGVFHPGPTVIEVDTGLLTDERPGPGINWGGGKHANSPQPGQTGAP
ncbi:MAG TPA: hypothetical protein VEB64_04005 [Azospirillaceae bacterium]|nr:hypothetical protein [Azospirillaceae bacterium]